MEFHVVRRAVALWVLLSLAGELAADSFRCGRKLITEGDSAGELIRACGEPFHKERGSEKLRLHGATKEVRVDRWYYKKSSRKLEHVIIIHKGRVAAVQTGGR